MNPPSTSTPDATPAHALGVELKTRITTQALHYRSGDEAAAAESVAFIFKKTRELMTAHPQALAFQDLAETLLNKTLRPYTARWHGWMTEDNRANRPDSLPKLRFQDEQVRRMVRAELQELQERLQPYQRALEALAQGKDIAAADRTAIDAAKNQKLVASLGVELEAGIRRQVEIAKGNSADEINQAEQAAILERRRVLSGATQPAGKLTNAIGLALSGGGIRSATFCLGIVQVLVQKGLLPQFDYLSTVSGGGYFGSFLSTALGTRQPGDTSTTTKDSAAQKIKDVFHRQEAASRQAGIESGLVRHLRNNSKYLLHGGFLGKMRMIGLMLSGMVWNLMIMLPLALFAALLAYLMGPWIWGEAIGTGGPVLPALKESIAGWVLLGLAGLFALSWLALPGIQLFTHGQPPKSKGVMFRGLWENLTLGLGLLTIVAGFIYLTPALFHLHEWLRTTLASASLAGFDLEEFSGVLPASATAAAGAVLAALSAWLTPKWPRLRALAVKLFILTGPLLLLFVFLLVGNRMGLVRSDGELWSPKWVLLVTLGLTAWNWLFVNINTLAPHRYYRNRLCECYLARRIPEAEGEKAPLIRALAREKVQGKTEVLQQVKLSSLGADLTAPYHLVNMTLNVPTSDNQNLRGRASDFFMASRHFYGSPLTGYAKTEKLEQVDPHFDLGTAMAVSGAAASTSMGWQSLPHFRFVMTLFNVRLGYWLNHPGQPAIHRLLSGAGPWYLFREMLGWMDEKCRYVNLSDGGHIENLAAYELLRRRCKFIVCVDAGCEPGMECADLLRLQRYAEIDLGIRMSFDTADLQLDANGLSRAHGILVKIDYAPETDPGRHLGWMLYLKLAMTGVEPAYVKDYQRQNSTFPHETTGDQFFEEEQFEAYRALGECAMEEMFRDEIVGPTPPTDIEAWFQRLANNLLPDNDEVFR